MITGMSTATEIQRLVAVARKIAPAADIDAGMTIRLLAAGASASIAKAVLADMVFEAFDRRSPVVSDFAAARERRAARNAAVSAL